MSKFQKKNFLIILISPSGGGKSAILKQVLCDNNNIKYSISYTTRKPRKTEKTGIDYNFVSDEEFHKLQKSGDLLESALVHGYWYGTSKKYIETELNKGYHIIMDIDVQGAKQIISKIDDAVSIFILPPSNKILIDRLIGRGTDSKEEIEIRLRNANNEMNEITCFQYLIINDDFDKAVKQVMDIIKVEENKINRYKNIESDFYGG